MTKGKLTAEMRLRRSSDNVRAELISAATQLFAEKGFAAVSAREICEVAKAPLSGMYRHFRDKKALYTTCAVAAHESMARTVFARLNTKTSTPNLLFSITKSLCDMHTNNTVVPKFILRQMLDRDDDVLRAVSDAVVLSPSSLILKRLSESYPPERAKEIIISIYSMAFGFSNMAPITHHLDWEMPNMERSDLLAVFILSMICPDHEWSDHLNSKQPAVRGAKKPALEAVDVPATICSD